MRISPTPRVCFGLLCGLLILVAGCGSPSSQSLDSLTVTATPATISVGGAAVLKAVAHLSDGTTQDVTAGTKWTLSNPALATLSSNALTAKAAGSLTVQAAYVEATPAGNSPAAATVTPQTLSASAQVTITAAGATGTSNVPTITWNTPAAITYGTALSSTQLSATANVPGTFVYTPAAGTVLKAGKQTLSAVFTPTDTQTYSAATASVQLSRQPGHPDHHLACAGRDLRGHRPERHTIGRHCKCARHLHVQPGRGRRSDSRHATTDGRIFTYRCDRLCVCHGARLAGRWFANLRNWGHPDCSGKRPDQSHQRTCAEQLQRGAAVPPST